MNTPLQLTLQQIKDKCNLWGGGKKESWFSWLLFLVVKRIVG